MSATPRPWTIEWRTVDEHNRPLCSRILGADGTRIVETDGGYYPPTPDDARLIERAVNAFAVLLAMAHAGDGEGYCLICRSGDGHRANCALAKLDAAHPGWREWA